MITIYGFGKTADLPDLSPFVVKGMTLLKMADVDYVVDATTPGFRRALTLARPNLVAYRDRIMQHYFGAKSESPPLAQRALISTLDGSR